MITFLILITWENIVCILILFKLIQWIWLFWSPGVNLLTYNIDVRSGLGNPRCTIGALFHQIGTLRLWTLAYESADERHYQPHWIFMKTSEFTLSRFTILYWSIGLIAIYGVLLPTTFLFDRISTTRGEISNSRFIIVGEMLGL